mmetsp:Transcript_44011/g.81792  ORF Transcript_44011/g.81792 Transcript_44011/m.81792 type:complete len:300 (-) Transcript_44011:214-1113(-)
MVLPVKGTTGASLTVPASPAPLPVQARSQVPQVVYGTTKANASKVLTRRTLCANSKLGPIPGQSLPTTPIQRYASPSPRSPIVLQRNASTTSPVPPGAATSSAPLWSYAKQGPPRNPSQSATPTVYRRTSNIAMPVVRYPATPTKIMTEEVSLSDVISEVQLQSAQDVISDVQLQSPAPDLLGDTTAMPSGLDTDADAPLEPSPRAMTKFDAYLGQNLGVAAEQKELLTDLADGVAPSAEVLISSATMEPPATARALIFGGQAQDATDEKIAWTSTVNEQSKDKEPEPRRFRVFKCFGV